jgi:hypothetical protein
VRRRALTERRHWVPADDAGGRSAT